MVCPAKAAHPKAKVEEGKLKALPRKLTGSRSSRVTPKQEEAPPPNTMVNNRTVATEKVKNEVIY